MNGQGAYGLVPGDPLEAPLPLRAHALQGVEDAVRAVDAFEVAVDLGAEEAPGEAVLRVAAQGDRAVSLHGHGHHARVGAVVGADDLVDGGVFHRPPTLCSPTSGGGTAEDRPAPRPQP